MLLRTLNTSVHCLRPLSGQSVSSAHRLRPSAAAPVRILSPLAPSLSRTARCLSQQTKASIEAAVNSAPVVLFMKGTPEMPQCGFSRGSVQILGLQGLDPAKFAAYNVLEDEELRAGIKEYSEWPTIPQLYVQKEFIGGYDILMQMHQDGQLSKLLEEKKLLEPAEEIPPEP